MEKTPIIEVQHITKRFKGLTAVKDVSFTIREAVIERKKAAPGVGSEKIAADSALFHACILPFLIDVFLLIYAERRNNDKKAVRSDAFALERTAITIADVL